MAIYRCKMCGGTIEFEPGSTVGICDSCGTKQTLPKTDSEVLSNLFNRANNLRLKCEFDKAEQIYEKIVEQDDSEAEAHWGIVLCKYGIEYVEDPKTFERIPTCHRTLYEPITSDVDYLATIDYSDASQQIIYEKEARAIDRIQKGILEIVRNEKPFDVFICYKETDENGKRTVDSAIANDIYYQLTQEGLKVFYAPITLEDKVGQEYEPYIFAALNSAKVMLVIGTKPEYFSAVWVKNEWSRFMKLMKTDRSKLLIPCYRDMDAYDLPEEFAHLQAQDMGKIGFINDVVRGIRKVISPAPTILNEKKAEPKETLGGVETSSLLDRAFLFLEDGDWDSADEYCEKVLDRDPRNAIAYLGKLMAELHVRKREDLASGDQLLENYSNYQKSVRFADKALSNSLKEYNSTIIKRRERIIYDKCKDILENSNLETELISAAVELETISDYENSLQLAEECRERAEVCRQDGIYNKAVELAKKPDISHQTNAKELFGSILNWKDSKELREKCERTLEELAQKEEELRKREEREKKRKKTKIIIISATAILVVATVFIWRTVLQPMQNYNDAVKIYDSGDYVAAYELFTELGSYKDAASYADKCHLFYIKDSLKDISVGDIFEFGSYEQDGDNENGKERIKWIVLTKEDDRVLVMSENALCFLPFNSGRRNLTWASCSLRTWLNSSFIEYAFGEEEQSMIPTVKVSSDYYGIGDYTDDRVFLLNYDLFSEYCLSNIKICQATSYAFSQAGLPTSSDRKCSWWLNTSGKTKSMAVCVNDKGNVDQRGIYVEHSDIAVRPAMWITFNP